jgi:Ala-tRNA(Pro) deacylase
MKDIHTFLDSLGIAYEHYNHPAVFTCEQAKELTLDIPGADTKNLFLRDKNAKRHFLVTVGHEKKVDLRALSELLNVQKLSFGSPERLMKYLGVEPGSVTILGLMNDTDHTVEFFVDEDVWQAESFRVHPLVNTASLVISKQGIEKFLQTTGHELQVLNVP